MASINISEQIKAWPMSKKIAMLAVLVVSIAGMFLLFSWIQKADYQVLYSDLSESDAGRIVQELRGKKISYKLGIGGTILVPLDKVYDLRLQLAAQGLPQGSGVGFELFDKTSFTTSKFIQKLNYRRALEGELARTIRSLSKVQQCRVHLAIPERSIFAWQENEPQTSAAVLVSLRPGRTLSNMEVEGIVHLVSSSVEGLSPETITVIDNKGKLLTKPTDDDMIGLSSGQMEYEHIFEKNMASKVKNILEPVVGKGKVRARVSATFDFTRSERTEERFDPEGVVVRSEQKTVEKSTSGIIGGTPGVASNLPGRATQQRTSSQEQSQKQDETINYETSKTITRVIDSPVTLERLSVAILIDGITSSQQGSIEKAEEYTLRSEEDIKYYEDIIKKTIGFTSERGDELTVVVMPFEDIAAEELPEVQKDYLPVIITILKYLVPLVVAVLFFLFIVNPLIKSITITPREAPGPGVPKTASEIEGQVQPKVLTAEKQVIEWANENPQQATGLIKGWLEER